MIAAVACSGTQQDAAQVPSPGAPVIKTTGNVLETPVQPSPEIQVNTETPEASVKNIILLIADGAGPAHLDATRIWNSGKSIPLNIDDLPVSATVRTEPLGGGIPDSASSATAIATGVLVASGVIAANPDGSEIPSILELMEEDGRATGVVVTSTVTHATPAAFYAHNLNRSRQNEIGAQLVESGVDVAFGGGLQHFIPGNTHTGDDAARCDSSRRDDRDLVEQARSGGYSIAFDNSDLLELTVMPALGLFACGNMAFDLDRPDNEPELSQMTSKAIELLSQSPTGFFLMVEGSRVDHAASKGDSFNTLGDMAAFDRAVGAAMDFANSDPNTLVIVAADHETGGLEVRRAGENIGRLDRNEDLVSVGGADDQKLLLRWPTREHTQQPVFAFAAGPGSERLSGAGHISDLFGVMTSAAGFTVQGGGTRPVTSLPQPRIPAVSISDPPDCLSDVEQINGFGQTFKPDDLAEIRIGITGHTNLWWGGSTAAGMSNGDRAQLASQFLESKKVDGVVWLGDELHLCQSRQIEAMSAAMEDATVPNFKVLGNHDLDDYSGELARDIQLERFSSLYGTPPYYSFDAGKFRFIFLADESARGLSFVSDGQMEFLRTQIDSWDGKIAVFSHHVLPVRREESLNAMIGAGSKNTSDLLKLVTSSTKVVFWGWGQQHAKGRDPVQRSGVVEYTPHFVTGFVDGQFIDTLQTSIVTFRQRRVTIEVFDVFSGALLEQFQFNVP